MSFDVLQGIFEADASGYTSELGDAADASDEFADSSVDLSGDIEEIEPASDSASGSVAELGGAAESSADDVESAGGAAESYAGSADEAGDSASSAGDDFDALGGSASGSVGPLQESSTGLESVEGSASQTGDALDSTAGGFETVGAAGSGASSDLDPLSGSFDEVGDSAEGAADSSTSAASEFGTAAGSASDAGAGASDAAGGFDEFGDSAESAGDAASSADFGGAAGDLDTLGDAGTNAAGGLDDAGGAIEDTGMATASADFGGAASDLDDLGEAGSGAGSGLDEAAMGAEDASDSFSGVSSEADQATDSLFGVESAGMAAGGAMMGIGVAGIGALESTKDMRGSLNQTALTMDMTRDETNALARSMTNATFPMDDAVASMSNLSALGPESADALEENVLAADNLADATGSSAEEISGTLAPAIQALDGDLSALRDPDAFVFAHHNTPLTIQDIASSLERMDFAKLKAMNMNSEDAALSMALFAEKTGYSGRVLRSEYNQALEEANGDQAKFYELLDLSEEEMTQYQDEMSGSTEMTNEYAGAANDTLTIVDELSHKYNDFLMAIGTDAGQVERAALTIGGVGIAMSGVAQTAPLAAAGMKALGASSMLALWPLAALAGAGLALWYVWDNDIGGIATKTKEVFSSVRTTIAPFISILRDDLGKTVTSLRQTWNAAVGGIMQDTAGLRAAVGPPLKALGHLIKLGFGAAAYGAFTLIRQGLALLRGDFGAMVAYGEDFNKRMKMLIGGSGIESMQILKNAVIGGLGAVKNSLAGGLSYVTGWGGRLKSTITNAGNRSMNALTGSVTRGISSVKNTLNGAYRFVTNWGRKTVSSFTNAGRNAMSSLTSAISNGISGVRDRMNRLARTIMSFLPPGASGPLGALKRRAKKIPSDIAKGILSGLGSVKKAGNKVAKAISDRLPLSPAKEGPLQKGPEERGHIIGQGLASGMAAERSTVAGATGELASAAAIGSRQSGPARRGASDQSGRAGRGQQEITLKFDANDSDLAQAFWDAIEPMLEQKENTEAKRILNGRTITR